MKSRKKENPKRSITNLKMYIGYSGSNTSKTTSPTHPPFSFPQSLPSSLPTLFYDATFIHLSYSFYREYTTKYKIVPFCSPGINPTPSRSSSPKRWGSFLRIMFNNCSSTVIVVFLGLLLAGQRQAMTMAAKKKKKNNGNCKQQGEREGEEWINLLGREKW